MRLLLDTQALVWYALGDSRLPTRARELIQSSDSVLFLSAVTVWEIVIKSAVGKLILDMNAPEFVDHYVARLALAPLPITFDHAKHVATLERHHRDPFDRLLVAQSLIENLPILTGDSAMRKYPAQLVWR